MREHVQIRQAQQENRAKVTLRDVTFIRVYFVVNHSATDCAVC